MNSLGISVFLTEAVTNWQSKDAANINQCNKLFLNCGPVLVKIASNTFYTEKCTEVLRFSSYSRKRGFSSKISTMCLFQWGSNLCQDSTSKLLLVGARQAELKTMNKSISCHKHQWSAHACMHQQSAPFPHRMLALVNGEQKTCSMMMLWE